MTNHLGNVLVTVSDRKLQVTGNAGGESNGECETGTGEDVLDVSERNGEPSYVAKTTVNLLPGFDNVAGESYEAYTDASLEDCIAYEGPEEGETGWHYAAEVISANDYYPFGMGMPGRKFSSGSYRYGFNGKENDNEVKGQGSQQDYGMRIYDLRLGRFLSVDPLIKKYPELTPYQFSSNTPISAIDIDGLEGAVATTSPSGFGTSSLPIPGYPGPGIQSFTNGLAPQPAMAYTSNYPNGSPNSYNSDGTRKGNFVEWLGNNGFGKLQNYRSYTQPAGNVTVRASGTPIKVSTAEETKYNNLIYSFQASTYSQFSSQSVQNAKTVSDDKGYVTLYRGVGSSVDVPIIYSAAKKGLAVPKGLLKDYCSVCNITPDQHVMGATSLYTSWTLSESVAEKFARGTNNTEGVILTLRVNVAELIDSKYSQQYFPDDFEFLLFGTRKADLVKKVIPEIQKDKLPKNK